MIMSHDKYPNPDKYNELLTINREIVGEFQSRSRAGVSTLGLYNQDSGIAVFTLAECDAWNRGMLDDLYTELGIDPDAPSFAWEEEDSYHSTNEKVFQVESGLYITERQTNGSRTDPAFSRFKVMVRLDRLE